MCGPQCVADACTSSGVGLVVFSRVIRVKTYPLCNVIVSARLDNVYNLGDYHIVVSLNSAGCDAPGFLEIELR